MSHAGNASGDPAGSPPTSHDPGASALQAADSDRQPRNSRVKTLAPPPPLAAFQQRAAPPVAPTPEIPSFVRDPRSETAALPQLVQPLESVWSEPAADPYLSSLRPTKPRTRAWGFVVAFGLGGLTAVAVGVAVMMAQPADKAASARATVQRSGTLTRVEPTQPQLMHPAPNGAQSPPAVGEPREPRTTPVGATEPADAPVLSAAQTPTAAAESVSLGKPSAPAESPRAIHPPRSAAVPRPQHGKAGPRQSQPVGSDTPASLDTARVSEVLPEQPTRDEIKRALEAIRPAIQTCIGAAHGTSFANVTIAGSGRVRHTSIEGAFVGTPQGSCMARALRSATVPRFAADSMTVRFPFVL